MKNQQQGWILVFTLILLGITALHIQTQITSSRLSSKITQQHNRHDHTRTLLTNHLLQHLHSVPTLQKKQQQTRHLPEDIVLKSQYQNTLPPPGFSLSNELTHHLFSETTIEVISNKTQQRIEARFIQNNR